MKYLSINHIHTYNENKRKVWWKFNRKESECKNDFEAAYSILEGDANGEIKVTNRHRNGVTGGRT